MRIEFERTLEDVLDWNVAHSKQSREARATRIKGSVFISMFVLLISEVIAIGTWNPWIAAGGLALTLIAGVSAYQSFPRSVRKRAHRIYRQSETDPLTGRHSLTIDDQYLREGSPTGRQDVLLSAVERVVESPTAVYIYIGPLMAHIIPRNRVLVGDLDAFVKELRERINK